ncbi:hypothetical protein MKW98_013603, partial [Papaver atlanticum]
EPIEVLELLRKLNCKVYSIYGNFEAYMYEVGLWWMWLSVQVVTVYRMGSDVAEVGGGIELRLDELNGVTVAAVEVMGWRL